MSDHAEMASSTEGNVPSRDVFAEDEEDWEYEYSATETETYYLTLDLSVREFLQTPPADVIHGTRGGYRVWYNPLFRVPEVRPANDELVAVTQDEDDDEELPEREEVEDDSIGMPLLPVLSPLDPRLQQERQTSQKTATEPDLPGKEEEDSRQEQIQIVELHSAHPVVYYRNLIFRGSWAENIGTEMIFAPHDADKPLPALRRLPQNVDLLAASSARIGFKEATLQPRTGADVQDTHAVEEAGGADEEDLVARYEANGGVYVHVVSDKRGERLPQAHFLEDLVALKRKRGEADEVTIMGVDTEHNELFRADEKEERRRKKARDDRERRRRREKEILQSYEMAGRGYAVSRTRKGVGGRPTQRKVEPKTAVGLPGGEITGEMAGMSPRHGGPPPQRQKRRAKPTASGIPRGSARDGQKKAGWHESDSYGQGS